MTDGRTGVDDKEGASGACGRAGKEAGTGVPLGAETGTGAPFVNRDIGGWGTLGASAGRFAKAAMSGVDVGVAVVVRPASFSS